MKEGEVYDEFGMFEENAQEHGLPYHRRPVVRRISVPVAQGRALSALQWGADPPDLVLLHGGSQNAHTWDTVAMALDRPLLAIDLAGHGHSDGPSEQGVLSAHGHAQDVATVLDAVAPSPQAVVGMSLGGLTTIPLAVATPRLVRRMVLVDITPGVTAEKAHRIRDFVNGSSGFATLDQMLSRARHFSPHRSDSSLRRGILHNAQQQPDGTWRWRHARSRREEGAQLESGGPATDVSFERLWDALSETTMPTMLCRGLRPDSVVTDDDEAELLRRRPDATIERFPNAGHSVQGDSPVELAQAIESFVP